MLTSPETDAALTDKKKDVALYAMTYGTTYVASVSHKLDNTSLLSALKAASHFHGPSVVLAPKVRPQPGRPWCAERNLRAP
jgi:pyruvate/2-oxoacid:ferredoxin oxidoreductase beta subunit